MSKIEQRAKMLVSLYCNPEIVDELIPKDKKDEIVSEGRATNKDFVLIVRKGSIVTATQYGEWEIPTYGDLEIDSKYMVLI